MFSIALDTAPTAVLQIMILGSPTPGHGRWEARYDIGFVSNLMADDGLL
jgi:hypothetical protein